MLFEWLAQESVYYSALCDLIYLFIFFITYFINDITEDFVAIVL